MGCSCHYGRRGCAAVLVDDAVMLDPTRMSPDEAERLYYSLGMHDIADIYAQVADVAAERDELENENESMVNAATHDKQVKLVEHLQDHIRSANTAADALYDYIEAAKPLNRQKLKDLLTAIELDPDSEP
jgi:hypothetical protein